MNTRFSSRGAPWELAAVLSAVVVVVGLAAVSRALSVPAGFVGVVAGVLALETLLFYHANRVTRQDAGQQRLTLATAMTVVRGGAVLVLAGFVVVGQPSGALSWLPALLFGAAALLDGLDGTIARATGSVSAFGARLDAEVDALALLVGAVVAVRIGTAPAVLLLAGVARYAFVGGIALRRRRGLTVVELPPRRSRKLLGALAMVVVFVVLTPVVGSVVAHPIAVAATVGLLGSFCRDWLLVSGRL